MHDHAAEYLLIGGHAVNYHGYPRYTGGIDIWVACNEATADALVALLREFGFDLPSLRRDLFLEPDQIVRMGVEPLRVKITTGISGVEFAECYARCVVAEVEGIEVSIISLPDLKQNKAASGRLKDLADLDNLP